MPQIAPSSCPHRPPCTACPRFGAHGIAPAARAALAALARSHGLAGLTEVDGPLVGFRLRARLAIRGRVGSPKIGLFQEGTHRVVSVPQCCVHHPLINRVTAVVRQALVDQRVPPYSEGHHLGLVRYLQVVVERSSQLAQVVLVANTPTAEALAPTLDLIRDRLQDELHSLWFNAQCERSNVILGPHFERRSGPVSVIERFGGPHIYYPPGAFGQNNLDVAERIIEELRQQIPLGSRVTEFYAGVGAIGLSLLERIAQLRMNEVSLPSLEGLQLGVDALDAAARAKVQMIAGSAEAAVHAAADADIVIADPPRRGLDPTLIQHLRNHPPARFLYVSCGLDSLVRDTAQLVCRGTLRLAALTAFNLLPFTEHVETLARFERR